MNRQRGQNVDECSVPWFLFCRRAVAGGLACGGTTADRGDHCRHFRCGVLLWQKSNINVWAFIRHAMPCNIHSAFISQATLL